MNEPFQVVVNGGQHTFSVAPEEARVLDVMWVEGDIYHVLYNGQSRHAVLQKADYKTKTFTFQLEGNTFSVQIEDAYDRLVQHLGLAKGGSRQVNHLKAPMPGLVIKLLAEPGTKVQKGDPLLILEAMKMENVIKAIGDATVKSVGVTQGEAVEKGHLLIEFE
jgi:biotin carboxyl carrier protein